MKDSNFDSIKEKFDHCGVNAPEALGEGEILNLLPGQPVQSVPPAPSKKKLVAGISAVAAAAVVTAGAVTFTSMFRQSALRVHTQTPAALRTFQTDEELKTTVGQVLRAQEALSSRFRYDYVLEEKAQDSVNPAAAPEAGASGSSSAASSSHNSTYVQTVGVDEADMVKTTDRYIFYCDGVAINVFSADGKNAKKVGGIFFGNPAVEEFYVTGDRLIVLQDGWAYDDTAMERGGIVSTVAAVYDISDVGNIRQLGSFSQSGWYLSSRMIGDTLYLVSNEPIEVDSDRPAVRRGSDGTPDSAADEKVPLDDIYAVQTPADSNYLVVSSIDIGSNAQRSETKAILGSANNIYCNLDNLYVTALQYSPEVYRKLVDGETGIGSRVEGLFSGRLWEDSIEDSDVYFTPEETQIIKISLKDGVSFVASGTVRGAVRNQYSLDEYNGSLRVATTSTDAQGTDVNNLFVLDSSLRQQGAVTGFAENESIKAVRYLGNTAYVITYEETDPLFVIDVSDPTAPAITGEVKISGFSTLLVPVDDNTLLGIGYHTAGGGDAEMEVQSGVKLVTFDVTDKAAPKVIDTKIFEGYSSQVQYDPKALLVNFERNDYAIPMSRYNFSVSDETWSNRFELLNFRVEGGKLVIVDEHVSEKFTAEYDIADRCVYVGNNMYLLGVHGEMESTAAADIECVPYK